METYTVRLEPVTKGDAQTAIDGMEDIFDEYGLPDETRLALRGHYRILASDVLIRFGGLDPQVGYDEHNGHA